jgi:hypothetical protein
VFEVTCSTVITQKGINQANPILCDTPENTNEEFEVIAEYEYDSISIYEI